MDLRELDIGEGGARTGWNLQRSGKSGPLQPWTACVLLCRPMAVCLDFECALYSGCNSLKAQLSSPVPTWKRAHTLLRRCDQP